MTKAKKDFSEVNTDRLYSTIAAATAEPEEQDTPAAGEDPGEQGEAAAGEDPAEHEGQEKQHARKPYKPRKVYDAQESADFLRMMKTAGRKGVKLPRINMAFAPEVYKFIQIMSRVHGVSMTDFVNLAMKEYMLNHEDLYASVEKLRNKTFRDIL